MVEHIDFLIMRDNIPLLLWSSKTLPVPKRKNGFGLQVY